MASASLQYEWMVSARPSVARYLTTCSVIISSKSLTWPRNFVTGANGWACFAALCRELKGGRLVMDVCRSDCASGGTGPGVFVSACESVRGCCTGVVTHTVPGGWCTVPRCTAEAVSEKHRMHKSAVDVGLRPL